MADVLDATGNYIKEAVKEKRARTRLNVATLDAQTRAVESTEGQQKITDLTLAKLDSKILTLENSNDRELIKNIEDLNDLDPKSRKMFDDAKKARKTK